jgi:hypothetical protein
MAAADEEEEEEPPQDGNGSGNGGMGGGGSGEGACASADLDVPDAAAAAVGAAFIARIRLAAEAAAPPPATAQQPAQRRLGAAAQVMPQQRQPRRGGFDINPGQSPLRSPCTVWACALGESLALWRQVVWRHACGGDDSMPTQCCTYRSPFEKPRCTFVCYLCTWSYSPKRWRQAVITCSCTCAVQLYGLHSFAASAH